MAKVLFFGYGAYRNKNKLAQVLGHTLGEGVGAVLEGYVLVYQTLNQLPANIGEFLRGVYGNDFKAYTIRKGSGVVSGIIWEITNEDLEIIKKWEFIPLSPWREIVGINLKSSGGKEVKAFTEKAKDDQPATKITDGLDYEEFENIRQDPNKKQSNDNPYYTQQQIEKIKSWLAKQR
jgi:hypothetical protein